MTNVYILTEEGREYNKKGCTYIIDTIRDQFKEIDQLVLCMGKKYNDSNFMIKVLDNDPNCYFVISSDKNVVIVNHEGVKGLKQALKDFPKQTSWQTAYMIYNT